MTDARPSDPTLLSARLGRDAGPFVFTPVSGNDRLLPNNGKPTVLVIFASWCQACHAEIPIIARDYQLYGNAVNFLGIDYGEPPQVAIDFATREHITFPIESLTPFIVHVPGKKLTRAALAAFRKILSKQTYSALVEIAVEQKIGGANDLDNLEARLGVYVEGEGKVASDDIATLDLPHAFVLDTTQHVRAEFVGFDSKIDRIGAEIVTLLTENRAKPR